MSTNTPDLTLDIHPVGTPSRRDSNITRAGSRLSLEINDLKGYERNDREKEEITEEGVVDVARAEAEFAELKRQLTHAYVCSNYLTTHR